MTERKESKIVIAAVSDGCSSAKYSSKGSKLCADGFIKAFEQMSDRKISRLCSSDRYDSEIKNIVLSAIKEAVENSGLEYYQLSATLVGMLISGKKAVIIHVGDGFCMKLYKNRIGMVSPPENGAVKNITFFATSPDAEKHIRVNRTKDFDSMIISTDGLPDKKIDSSLFNFRKLHDMLEMGTFNDDCGVILISRKNNI